jgi:AraC-like DNA-binding protein
MNGTGAAVGIDHKMTQVRLYLEEKYSSAMTVPKVARDCGLSSSALAHTFTKTFGTSPVKYLTQVRIAKAVEILSNEDRSIKEIAFAVGFGSPSHFCRTFRRMLGCAPTEYQDKQRRVTFAAPL